MSFLPYERPPPSVWLGSWLGSSVLHGGVALALLTSSVAFVQAPTGTILRAPEFEVTLEILDAAIVTPDAALEEPLVPPDAEPLLPEAAEETDPEEESFLTPEPATPDGLLPDADAIAPDALLPDEDPAVTGALLPEADPIVPDVDSGSPVAQEIEGVEPVETALTDPDSILPSPLVDEQAVPAPEPVDVPSSLPTVEPESDILSVEDILAPEPVELSPLAELVAPAQPEVPSAVTPEVIAQEPLVLTPQAFESEADDVQPVEPELPDTVALLAPEILAEESPEPAVTDDEPEGALHLCLRLGALRRPIPSPRKSARCCVVYVRCPPSDASQPCPAAPPMVPVSPSSALI
ncbi:hypothetical protein KDD17_17385 [Sulfitobacter albidus]|uniref:Uncharacterized protein n=1 Tax=Sulfitobacter albidus TaxID=2829501 RepID=A0A975JGJ3_9RHOB|nr:hypothetical protein [Sulfitobacter albidus]QUJ78114.1 hypothetical protein KDD17_17385 [Sulfitobacter albidus]